MKIYGILDVNCPKHKELSDALGITNKDASGIWLFATEKEREIALNELSWIEKHLLHELITFEKEINL